MAEFTLVRKVADGSAVEAYFGQHDGAHYLVQLTRPALAQQPDLYGRFLDASKTSASVHHPELLSPRLLGCAPDGRLWAVSDAITGWTAADLLARRGAIPEGLCIEWGLAVCEALAVLHARGRVHGCLAPRHLHVSGDPNLPEVRLLDTSLLHFRGPRSFVPPGGAVLVEPEYLSPERASGSRGTPAGDVWGLGVLLVELLTGHRPFRARTAAETRRLVLECHTVKLPPRLSRWQPFLDACLAPRPLDRFGSALEVRQALVGLLA
ncbi:MAG: protein kinase [Myxococcota bacterium]|jgi:serine/threonine-protein kinase